MNIVTGTTWSLLTFLSFCGSFTDSDVGDTFRGDSILSFGNETSGYDTTYSVSANTATAAATIGNINNALIALFGLDRFFSIILILF